MVQIWPLVRIELIGRSEVWGSSGRSRNAGEILYLTGEIFENTGEIFLNAGEIFLVCE